MSRLVLMCGLVLTAMGMGQAQVKLSGDTVITFASADEGRRILTNRDDFIRALSPFDRAARVKTDKEVSEQQLLEFVGRNVLDWTEPEKAVFVAALDRLKTPFDGLALPWPKTIYAIKTTGNEEGGALYTRDHALILPKRVLTPTRPVDSKLLAHELFHILSRSNPELRERLYQAIGFVKCTDIEFPETLKNRKLTNPDAPANDHCIRVQVAGASVWAVPIIYSRTQEYDVKSGGEFFRYMESQLFVVDRRDDAPEAKPVSVDAQPRLVEFNEVTGFYEQVGKNTRYIIHPEEILADNFADLVMHDREVPSPEILKKLHDVLTEKHAAVQGL
jgi:hypothetical protein